MAFPGGDDAFAAAQRLAAVLRAAEQTALQAVAHPAHVPVTSAPSLWQGLQLHQQPLQATSVPAQSAPMLQPPSLGTAEGALAALGLTASPAAAPATQQQPVAQPPAAPPLGHFGGAGAAVGQLAPSLLAPQLLQPAPLGGTAPAAASPGAVAVLAALERLVRPVSGLGAAGASSLGVALPGQGVASTGIQPHGTTPAASGLGTLPGLSSVPNALHSLPAVSSAPPPPPPSMPAAPSAASTEKLTAGVRVESSQPPPKEDAAPKETVKPCHLHTRPSQKCKFCQRALLAQQTMKEQAEQAKREEAEVSKKLAVNLSPMLKEQVLMSSYYKSLLLIDRLDDFVEEIKKFVDSIEIYRAGSTLEPSCFICCVYRLVSLSHSDEELQQVILDNEDSSIVRCVGFLFLRCVQPPDQLWDMLEEFMLDDAKLKFADAGREVEITIGEYVEMLLLKEKYFNMPLPRIPMAVRRKLEERVAPLAQYRKRTGANRRIFVDKRRLDLPVEVCVQGRWMHGDAVEVVTRISSRIKVRVQLEDAGEEVLAHIGRVVLRGPAPPADRKSSGSHSRSRSRGRRRGHSPDWSRWKGKSDQEMIEDLRQRARDEAVCADRKDYARRPPRFDAGLAIKREHGSAEARMIEEETYVAPDTQRRKATQEKEAESDRLKRRRTEEEEERQRKLKDIFEKYGQSKGSASAGGHATDIDRPDMMRLG